MPANAWFSAETLSASSLASTFDRTLFEALASSEVFATCACPLSGGSHT